MDDKDQEEEKKKYDVEGDGNENPQFWLLLSASKREAAVDSICDRVSYDGTVYIWYLSAIFVCWVMVIRRIFEAPLSFSRCFSIVIVKTRSISNYTAGFYECSFQIAVRWGWVASSQGGNSAALLSSSPFPRGGAWKSAPHLQWKPRTMKKPNQLAKTLIMMLCVACLHILLKRFSFRVGVGVGLHTDADWTFFYFEQGFDRNNNVVRFHAGGPRAWRKLKFTCLHQGVSELFCLGLFFGTFCERVKLWWSWHNPFRWQFQSRPSWSTLAGRRMVFLIVMSISFHFSLPVQYGVLFSVHTAESSSNRYDVWSISLFRRSKVTLLPPLDHCGVAVRDTITSKRGCEIPSFRWKPCEFLMGLSQVEIPLKERNAPNVAVNWLFKCFYRGTITNLRSFVFSIHSRTFHWKGHYLINSRRTMNIK